LNQLVKCSDDSEDVPAALAARLTVARDTGVRDVAIAGIGATPYYKRGETAGQSITQLAGEAIIAACADAGVPASVGDHTGLWTDVSAITLPVLLVLGADSPFTGEEDVAEFRRRLPAARVEVPGAGHAAQSDQPLALARLIEDFLD
jgi:pimeloyl-ACP methyl ester carboxylesterase